MSKSFLHLILYVDNCGLWIRLNTFQRFQKTKNIDCLWPPALSIANLPIIAKKKKDPKMADVSQSLVK